MVNSVSNVPLRIKPVRDEKLFARSSRVSKDSSFRSVEVYYGGSPAAIPFTWETRPGTPKAEFRKTQLSPLTPPPSFLPDSPKTPVHKKPQLKKTSLLYTLLPNLSLRRKIHSPSSVSSLTSSYSSSEASSVSSSPHTASLRELMLSRSRSFDSKVHVEDEPESPVSSLCFGISRGTNPQSSNAYSSSILKLLRR